MDGIEVQGEGGQAAETGKRTRRIWTTEEKLRIVRESQKPGAMRRQIAQRHGVHVSVLNRWRAEQLRDTAVAKKAKKTSSRVRLLPVLQVRKSPPSRGSSRPILATIAGTDLGIIEVNFPANQRLTVRGVVDSGLLRTVIEELSRC